MARQMGTVMLGSIELFCLAAELESFTAAANQAGLTPAAASRAIARLEERLQVRLFVRTTRKIRLTDGGRAYYAQCRQALNQLAEAERELTGHQAEPAGVLRISAPTTYGHHRLLPMLPAFRKRYPKVRVDVHLSNYNIDFTADGYDLAIRAREPQDSGLVARRLVAGELAVVASPGYLKRAGRPKTLEDLARHECPQFLLPRTGQKVPWTFLRDGVEVELPTEGSITITDDVLGLVTLARAGAGLVQTQRFIVEEDLQRGTLVEVLQKFAGRERPFSVVFPASRHMPLRVRLFIDFLAQGGQPSGMLSR